MKTKYFSLIVTGNDLDSPVSEEQLLDATDALGNAGCTDCSVMGHLEGLELAFHRQADSLDDALATALRDAGTAGLKVLRVELNQQALAETVPAAP
jgi:hypothetical protein